MRWSFDRLGFPLLRIGETKLEFHLLPVTKWQFERFLEEPDGVGDDWYEALLQLNPRASFRRFPPEHRERLFLTGLLGHEALLFAGWMGGGFRLPEVEEWREAFRWLEEQRFDEKVFQDLLGGCAHPSVVTLLRAVEEQVRPRTWLDLTLMRGGVVEWVEPAANLQGLGQPRPEFHSNAFHPLHDIVKAIDSTRRASFFGLRLVRESVPEDVTPVSPQGSVGAGLQWFRNFVIKCRPR